MTTPHPMLRELTAVLIGGALGSLLRYLTGHYFHYSTSSPFPVKTLLVNVAGCLLAGFFAMRLPQVDSTYRLFVLTGFLGAFTTFSTFSLETVALVQNGHVRTAVWNIALSTVAGVVAVLAGMWMGKTGA
jgi:fluoride exporter